MIKTKYLFACVFVFIGAILLVGGFLNYLSSAQDYLDEEPQYKIVDCVNSQGQIIVGSQCKQKVKTDLQKQFEHSIIMGLMSAFPFAFALAIITYPSRRQ